MSSEGRVYRVTLVPIGTTNQSKPETRTFEFETETTDKKELKNEASRAVAEAHVMDSSTFRAYWEVESVTPVPTNPSGLAIIKRKLQQCTLSKAENLADQYARDYTVLRMHSTDPDTGTWMTHGMLVHSDMVPVIKKWRLGSGMRYGTNGKIDPKILSEAAIRTAEKIDPKLEERLQKHPGMAHTRILALAIKFEDIFERTLRPLLP
jgi:hypothetical protein